jgi:hypothetical protein
MKCAQVCLFSTDGIIYELSIIAINFFGSPTILAFETEKIVIIEGCVR